MIPNQIHFVYTGGRPFSFVHYLAVRTAWTVNRPGRILFHHTEEPTGQWWERARPMLTLHRVEPITEIFGNPVNYPAHQADVIRLRMLKALGGIYLDLDVISLNPLEPLRSHSCVMGMEPGVGLCNAVILAEPNAPFIATWLEAYRDFDARQWNRHSVQRPWQLARQMPDAIRVEDPYAFFYPSHNDPVHRYLWGERPTAGALLARVAKNVVKGTLLRLGGCDDAARLWLYGNFHVLRGSDWHARRLERAYCLHLWEGLWGERYLKRVDPQYLRHDPSPFARRLRSVLGPEAVRELAASRLFSTRLQSHHKPPALTGSTDATSNLPA